MMVSRTAVLNQTTGGQTMKRLSVKTIERLDSEMAGACQCGNLPLWSAWADSYGDRDAVIEMPTGELMNERIRGFAWAWASKGRIQDAPIEKSDRFNANGLEGKVIVRTTLTVALLVYRELPPHRIQIRAEV
jgi:hypothetical protein